MSDFETGLGSSLGSEWVAVGDLSASGGTSAELSRVEAPSGFESATCLRLSYELKATQAAPYPDCSARLIFSSAATGWTRQDVSGYDGLELTASSSLEDDQVLITASFESPDGTYETQYDAQFALTPTPRRISLPFASMIPGGWFVANGKVPSPPSYTQCCSMGIEKKGSSGEKGQIFLDDVKLYGGTPGNAPWGRAVGPVHSILPEVPPAAGDDAVAVAVDCSKPFLAHNSRLGGAISLELYGADVGDCSLPGDAASGLGLKLLRCGPMGAYNWRTAKSAGDDGTVYDGMRVEDMVAFARSIGAEPMIEVNLKGWAPDESDTNNSPADCMDKTDAGDLVTYLNGTKHLGVKYFFMDNEFEFWQNSFPQCWETPCTADQYIQRFAAAAYAMKKAQAQISGNAQDILIVGPEISSSFTDYKTNASGETYGGLGSFPPYFLKTCKSLETDGASNPEHYRLLDVFSFHLYPAFRSNLGDPYSFIPLSQALESTRDWWDESYQNAYCASQPRNVVLAMIPRFNGWINQNYPGTKLAVTEFGLEADPNVPYPQEYRVLYMSELFGIMAKHGLDIATQHCLSDDQYLGLTDRAGNERPQYFPLMLYAKNFKGTVLEASAGAVSGGGRVQAYACDDGEGSIVVMLVNEEARELAASLAMSGIAGEADKSFGAVLAPLSLTCLKVKKAGSLSGEAWRYGAAQLP